MALNPDQETPGRKIVRHNGGALVEAMKMALAAGDPDAAQIVACECVVVAETKDHPNWELIGKCAKKLKGPQGKALRRPTRKSRTRKTSTSITARAGAASCGSNRSA